MKRLYWFLVAYAVFIEAFSILGRLVDPIIPEHGDVWLYLKVVVFDLKEWGLQASFFFLFLAALNWLGSFWSINSKKLDFVSRFLVWGGGFAILVGLVLVIIGGMMSTLGSIGLYGFGGSGLVAISVAFFIRGMIFDHLLEEFMAEQRRQQNTMSRRE